MENLFPATSSGKKAAEESCSCRSKVSRNGLAADRLAPETWAGISGGSSLPAERD